ncbi:hypothetical protein B7494_g7162 [Chlorociboria aeruginascens]|nr:hypothetical protein B7494_g7162 [Chlorociboria aeruginascens]
MSSSNAESSAAVAARGPAQQPLHQESAFPQFRDGDVLIMSATGKSWKLHSTILINASTQFKGLLTNFPERPIPKRQRTEEKTVKWWLRMVPYVKDRTDERFRSFEAVAPNDRQLPSFENMSGYGDEPVFHKTYDNFFRCLYFIEPSITNDQDDGGSYYIHDIATLLLGAEHLGAAAAVRNTCESYLLHLDQTLWTYIGSKPEHWADFGFRLQSSMIFKEAMIHVVGAWDLPGALKKDVFNNFENGEAIVRLALLKARELKEKKVAVERRLTEYYPAEMMHVANPTTDVPGRAHHRGEDGGVDLYRKIGKGGEAYVDKATRDNFHRSFNMSARGQTRFEEALSLIKGGWKVIVQELIIDNLVADRGPNAKDLAYLTCTNILDAELPWKVAESTASGDDIDDGGELDEDLVAL